MVTTVTIKGQVTIPKPIREQLGLEPGSKVEFKSTEHGVVLKPATGRPNRLRRFLGHAGPGMSTDEIMALTRGEE